MIIRWLSYIQLFDFDVKHIKNEKNDAIDDLSRWELAEVDSDEEDDSDAFFDAKMNVIFEYSITRIWFHKAKYLEEDLMLGEYLETLQRFDGNDDQNYQRLRKLSRMFFIRDDYLFKHEKHREQPSRRVIETPKQ